MRSTFRPEVIGDIGGFGGLFSFAQHRYTPPGRPQPGRFGVERRLIDLVFTVLDSPYSVEILRGVTSSPVDVVVSSMRGAPGDHPWFSGLVSTGRSGAIIVASELTAQDQLLVGERRVQLGRVDLRGPGGGAGQGSTGGGHVTDTSRDQKARL